MVVFSSSATAKKKAKPSYGLGIESDLDITTALGRKMVTDSFGQALSTIQKAYRTLTNPNASAAKAAASGPVPAYLTAQIANYQAALARLGG